MKLNVLLSILFAIVTTFTAIHEVEHIAHDDSSTCLVCHVNNNLASADVIDKPDIVEIVHFEKITQNYKISNLHVKDKSNLSRAPPFIS